MQSLEDRVAYEIQKTFASLPRKSRPRTLLGTSREWVPLSGIIFISGIISRILGVHWIDNL